MSARLEPVAPNAAALPPGPPDAIVRPAPLPARLLELVDRTV